MAMRKTACLKLVLKKVQCGHPTWSVLKEIICKTSTKNIHTSCTTLKTNDGAKSMPLNPIDELQPYIAVPIVPDKHMVFNPSEKEVEEGTRLFVPDHKHDIQWIKSVVDLDKLPDYNVPEVAFVGRSNVGKSSLIQAMFSRAPEAMAKVGISKQPGFTKTLRLFQVGKAFTLVDMPGYGHNMPSHFVESVEAYLKTRKNLKMTFLLIDGKLGITRNDDIMYRRLQDFQSPFSIVMTKIDKVGRSLLLKNLVSLTKYRDENTYCCFSQPFLTSSKTGVGVPLLQTFISYLAGSVRIEGS